MMVAKRRRSPIPFSGQGANYTQVPNEVFDLQRTLKATVFCVLAALARATYGWHILFAPRTHNELMAETGIGSRTTMRQCINDLLKKKLILKLEVGTGRDRRTYYGLCSEETCLAYREAVAGRLNIKQAQRAHADQDDQHDPGVIHTWPDADGSEAWPDDGSPVGHSPPVQGRPGNGRTQRTSRETQDIETHADLSLESHENAAEPYDSASLRKGFLETASENLARFLSWLEERARPRDRHQ